MLDGLKIIVILPAYNAAKTLARTVAEIPRGIVDEIILTDDASRDETAALSRELGLVTLVHEKNRGYGGNQKTCYAEALARGGRHRGDAAPGLPIFPETGLRHGGHDRLGPLQRRAGLAHPGQGRAARRHATL